jgi:sigma-54 dependent transcriptional regulator, acetoin dehydrogenase operon transcriptional activator AcoR
MSSGTKTMQPIGARQAAPSDAGLVLLCAEPIDSAPSVVPLPGHPLVIGREPPRGGLRLEQAAVSRLHAKIVYDRGAFWLTDLESRNGTFVLGQRAGERVTLQQGDEIRIGDALFKFVTSGIDQYLPYRVDGTVIATASRRSTLVPELVGGLQMDRVAKNVESAARTDLPVLVQGESGTGKEIVARAVHRLTGRSGAFCAVNCAAIPGNLFESELFGARKGAYTGADRDKTGIIMAANGGTLFLDEVGDMPLEMQAKLLRVLEAREVRPVGATLPEPVDVRIVSATHRDLRALVAEERFRGDLLARLHGYDVLLPPLRARKEDVYPLSRHFLAQCGKPGARMTFGFLLALCDYDWPFNVRELEVAVRRALADARDDVLDVSHLPEMLRRRAESYGTRSDATSGAESEAEPSRAPAPNAEDLRKRLAFHKGNVAAVARDLGRDPKQVHRWMQKYGISPTSFRT